MNLLAKLALFEGCAYAYDVMWRPARVAAQARAAAAARGKPCIDVGCGTAKSSAHIAIFGPTGRADVNCDGAASGACLLGKPEICHCDAYSLPWPDKTFGALFSAHVLEHLLDPAKALAEWNRVADELFVVTPAWWCPHTYLWPDHAWAFVGGRQIRLPWRT